MQSRLSDAMPRLSITDAPPTKLYLPGEIGRKRFRFQQSQLKLLVCPSNEGAHEIAEALRAYVLSTQPELEFSVATSLDELRNADAEFRPE